MFKSFLIKYAEIGVKGKNRYLFENALVDNAKRALDKIDGNFKVTKENGRIYAIAEGDYDFDEAVDVLQHVFGIVESVQWFRLKTMVLMIWQNRLLNTLMKHTLTKTLHLRLWQEEQERIIQWIQ